jgi:hypothetical protein
MIKFINNIGVTDWIWALKVLMKFMIVGFDILSYDSPA